MSKVLIADSGSTKTEWRLLQQPKRSKTIFTQGLSPYFLDAAQIEAVLRKELLPKLPEHPAEVFFYGTGNANPANARMIKGVLAKVFPGAAVEVRHDLMGAARALCGQEQGIACILGTGSNSGYYNGKAITRNSPGLGYVLGDEGSGAYLGKRVLQYYLYGTFDEELKAKFEGQYTSDPAAILDAVYKQPLPNRYLASYARFLSENRGHYMVENIIEDGLNDFFFQHLCKYRESWSKPIHFIGGVAHAFADVLRDLGRAYEFEIGKIVEMPMDGLVKYHAG
ncbi:N-acetylglucosamine kinase [Dinghuibacter silviterrae]|uniref:N-acetylglucosamine kinase-like BadF-type ATPase n=1 Tax=Dinghuibacter silviterrae TaxID=1539049 RepID=A0A4R8DIC7_9BACT|nr:N-acetylglucosamine kinase [Dinghuibacter silviterrae]TDW97317.1 N-acetylglucosamine kinase-like BadF-type ATPase [Dinghuibacter silviterrae]